MNSNLQTWCWLARGVVVWGALGVCAAAAPAQSSVATLEAISKAWHERESRFQTVRLTWVERQTRTKGMITKILGPADKRKSNAKGLSPGSVVPPNDVTYEVANSLLLSGEQLRYERADRQWSEKANAFVIEPYTACYDGKKKVGKSLRPNGSSYHPHPEGDVRSTFRDEGSPGLLPALIAFRPSFTQCHLINLETFSVVSIDEIVNGKSRVRLQKRVGSALVQVWVDPAREYLITRHLILSARNVVLSKLDVDYHQDPQGGWIPDAWHVTSLFVDGSLLESSQSRVTGCQINELLRPAECDIEFPPGTEVMDITGQYPPYYIDRGGGTKRPISIEEKQQKKSYEELLTTDPPINLRDVTGYYRFRSFWALAVVILVTGGLLCWRRVRNRSATS